MPIDPMLEAALRRDRLVVVTALAAVIALSWAYLLAGAGTGMSALETTRVSQFGTARGMSEGAMAGRAGMAMMAPAVWTPGHAALMFLMWCVMMVAMMLPSAARMILLFAAVQRRQRQAAQPHAATGLFALGYLAAWAGFSLAAVIFQWGLQRPGILSPMLVGSHAVFGGVLLLAAGLYQLSAMKHACLRQCRSPLQFLGTHWQPGAHGGLRMGLVHGAYCVGCCWALMGLLFFGGVMNLYWNAGLALLVLSERTLPGGHWLARGTGMALLAWGAGTLALAF